MKNKRRPPDKPHRGFVVYRTVLAYNANAVIGRAMQKQRCRCCVLFLQMLYMGVWILCFDVHHLLKQTLIGRKRNADGVVFMRITQRQCWRCTPTLPSKHRNRDAVCSLKSFCLSSWFIGWTKNQAINIPHSLSTGPQTVGYGSCICPCLQRKERPASRKAGLSVILTC